MKVALVHDWLVGMGGGERVLEAIASCYPGDFFTLVSNLEKLKGTFFEGQPIISSFLQKFPKAASWYRYYLPFFPLAIEQFDLSHYDLIISSSHAVAKGVLTHPRQLHICYCHTPMRYAWDLYHEYLRGLRGLQKKMAQWVLHYLRHWDVLSSNCVDHFIVNSNYVATRVQKYYRRKAKVIYPPVSTHKFEINTDRENYYITCSRLVPYKKIDVIVEAFSKLPDRRLLIIGDGPEIRKIKSKASSKKIEFLGYQSDENYRTILEKAKAFLFMAEEDFGIAPVEAQAAGIPVIAYGKGGVLETVIPEVTGLFFEHQTSEALIQKILEFERKEDCFFPEVIKSNAERFNENLFRQVFEAFVQEKLEEHKNASFLKLGIERQLN